MIKENITKAILPTFITITTLAKDHDWYREPFPIQLFINHEGFVVDNVSHSGLTEDITIITNAYETT